jgi:hypothetical protein
MKINLMGLATLLCAVLNSNAVLAAPQVAQTTIAAPPSASTPAEKDGLTVVLEPLTNKFQPGEPLAIKVTFQNTSKEPFRLPDQVNPAKYGYWELQLTNVDTGKVYSGISSLPTGAAPRVGDINPVAVAPGETLATTATLQNFAYVEGALDYEAAKNAYFQMVVASRGANGGGGGNNPPRPQLPSGTYQVRVYVAFASYPTIAVPERIRAAAAEIAAGPIPLWKEMNIWSNPVEIKIVTAPAANLAPTAAPVHP